MTLGRVGNRSTLILAAGALVITLLALTGVHWVFTVAAFGTLALLSMVQPSIGAALVVLSVPVQSTMAMPFVRGQLTFTQLVLFALIAGWGVLIWRRRIWLDSIVVGFVLVIAAYVVSFIAVDVPGNWFQETYRWAVAGAFYLICRSVITNWQHIRWLIWAMTIGVMGVSIHAFYQLVTDSSPGQFIVGGAVRVYSTFGTPNTLAAYLEMTVPMLLACLAIAWWSGATSVFSKWEIIAFAVASAFGLLTIGLTQSRGGWIGVAVACAVLWVNIPGRSKWILAGAAAVVTVAFLLTPPGQSQIERFSDSIVETEPTSGLPAESSYDVGTGRDSLWKAAISMIEDNPLTGVGAGEFDEQYREYTPSWLDRFPRGQAHNVWLQMGAQAGIWGIAAFAVWYFASVWGVVTARRRVSTLAEKWLITGVIAVFAAYSLHSLVDYLNVLSMGLQLSAITAIALNLAPEPLTRYEREPKTSAVIANLEPTPCP